MFDLSLEMLRVVEEAAVASARTIGMGDRPGSEAVINGASERSIMRQTGHESVAMVRRYIRDGELFRENAAARLGL